MILDQTMGMDLGMEWLLLRCHIKQVCGTWIKISRTPVQTLINLPFGDGLWVYETFMVVSDDFGFLGMVSWVYHIKCIVFTCTLDPVEPRLRRQLLGPKTFRPRWVETLKASYRTPWLCRGMIRSSIPGDVLGGSKAWFMDNPFKNMDDLGVPPWLRKPPFFRYMCLPNRTFFNWMR